jgi:hypothetical protein
MGRGRFILLMYAKICGALMDLVPVKVTRPTGVVNAKINILLNGTDRMKLILNMGQNTVRPMTVIRLR